MKSMKEMKLMILLAATLSAAPAAAGGGNDKGNGGDAYVCNDGKAYLLDYREAKRFGLTLTNPVPNGSVREIVEAVLKRWSRLDERSELYRTSIEQILRAEEGRKGGEERVGAVLFTHDELMDVPDSNERSTPRGCVKKQLVVQERPQVSTDPVFMINVDIWDRMDNYQKALTIFHEAFVTEAVSRGHTDTRMARRFNSYVNSDQVTMNVCDYMKFADEIRFPHIYYGGLRFSLTHSTNCHPDGSLKSATLARENTAFHESILKPFTDFDRDNFPLSLEGKVEFAQGAQIWTQSQTFANGGVANLIRLDGSRLWEHATGAIGYDVKWKQVTRRSDGLFVIYGVEKVQVRSRCTDRMKRKFGCSHWPRAARHLGYVDLRYDPRTRTFQELESY